MPRHKYELDKNRFEATERNITLININQHEEAINKLKFQKDEEGVK